MRVTGVVNIPGSKLRFDLVSLRFAFTALDPVHFPAGKAANVLRGAFGTIFRGIACRPDCPDSRVCPERQTCSYARVFTPDSDGKGPSGLADSPRPFVFRARHLDGRMIPMGSDFHFGLNLFDAEEATIGAFTETFRAIGAAGIGPRRGRAELRGVGREPMSLDLTPRVAAPDRVTIEFLTPTELKHEHRIVDRPEFPVLFARIRDRVSTLRRLYGPGPLEMDYSGSNVRAAGVRLVRSNLRREQVDRRSSRTGQTHSIGGFAGEVEYEGDMREFLPFLEAARWVGVGRQAVWGKGEIQVSG